ncbi:hypothetical protein BGW36DRAFT_425332 [Talaromyces proteolyticus]|uniref:NACHT domain-containing protein n=1 Tax=Talaromyces proteolyticus TaxID=1131652 RepID=A0AAD4Q2N0_9EURO|nr:uncharacterized protein BGW36DRAFT_425332 [Talaromyces proteolyticus]KAH8700508.1 hypothetical protein BGW36DRAFT_425332 [Talaromyces proteolyticus]
MERRLANSLQITAAIHTFCDFGVQLLGYISEVTENQSRVGARDDFVDTATRQLTRVEEQVRENSIQIDAVQIAAEERLLENLRSSCHMVAKTLFIRLRQLKNAQSQVQTQWIKEDAEILETRLISFREALQSIIPWLLGQCIDRDVETLDEELKSLIARLQKTTSDGNSQESLNTPALALLDGSLTHSIKRNGQPEKNEENLSSDGITPQSIFSDHEIVLQDFILESLSFSSMKDREEGVDAAHDKTFEWIFDPDPKINTEVDSLSNWLQTDSADGVFWITGKPGSGKSTLMRFIIDHPKTQEGLRIWAGDKTLITAGFYFWISGTLEQRSQTGLLRSLLFQLLSSRRHLIPLVFSELWERLKTTSTRDRVKAGVSWEISELANALKRFIYCIRPRERICIFIDGLDEFDGDHQQIVDFFRAVTSSHQHVKLCLSSRPLPAFWSSFAHAPKIQLHELTYTDMVHFVQDRFDAQGQMHALMLDSPEAASILVKDIVNKADGVFLWVSLVVRTLLHEHNYQKVADVYSLLQTLPTELDDLFQYILFNGKSQHDMHIVSRLFQLMRAREIACDIARHEGAASMTIWEFALADQINYQAALANKIQDADEEEVFRRCQTLSGQLENQCAGLIVMHDRSSAREGLNFADDESSAQKFAENKIAYVHRTVKDFFAQPEIWSKIVSRMIDDDFDPHARLLGSYISQLKRPLRPFRRHRQLDEWWPGIVLAMTHARCVDKENRTMQISLIRELDKTISAYWLPREASSYNDHWARNAFGTYEKRKRIIFHEPFLSLAGKFGLEDYVRTSLYEEDYQYQGGIPLLGHCVEFLVNRRKTVYPLSQPDLVATLLHYGEDPNQSYRDLDRSDRTPWLLSLDYLREGDRRGWMQYYDLDPEGLTRYAKVIELLIIHGADPNALLVETRFDPSNTALEVITMVYEKYASPEFERLRQMLLERGAQWRKET